MEANEYLSSPILLRLKKIICASFLLIAAHSIYGQGFLRKTYHDAEKKNLKEAYHVKDTIGNILNGKYVSYHLSGSIESRGQFTDNTTTGVWEFFYESGKLKMRGILEKNANYGLWEYFYESGQKSMEGVVNGKNREGEWISYYENGQVKEAGHYASNKRDGLWKSYLEDGALKGEIEYTHDAGRFIEYYHSGKVFGEGPRAGTRNVGHWRFFAEDGSLLSEGEYENGKKQGQWYYYYPDGKIASKGKYVNDRPDASWEYFYEDGKLSRAGGYENGVRIGSWRTLYEDGATSSETVFRDGRGEIRQFYPSGKLKSYGMTVHDERDGKWVFYYEDGRKEGECVYAANKGTYYGYFPNGALQTKGPMTNDLKTGTWEIYKEDGTLSGYYRPFYDDKKLGEEIVALASASASVKKRTTRHRRKAEYFTPRLNEFRGLIVAGNPVMAFAGRLPLGVEFYLQERLGHEFEFIGIRAPFFKRDLAVPAGERFERGYEIVIKQKLYNPLRTGMWYFGHEIRFTNYGHFINQPISVMTAELFTFSCVEQRMEWGLLTGYRISRSNVRSGLTIDAFASADIGYRGFDVDPKFASYFDDMNQSRLSTSFHFGVNFGNVFSFR